MVRSSKERADEIARRKAEGAPRRGDRRAGRAKTPYPPRGGRNSGGRGRERSKLKEPQAEPAPAVDDADLGPADR